MKKYTQKQLRELVSIGAAEDYTNKPSEAAAALSRLDKVGYSSGTYGPNGALFRDPETGTMYAITARNSNLFAAF